MSPHRQEPAGILPAGFLSRGDLEIGGKGRRRRRRRRKSQSPSILPVADWTYVWLDWTQKEVWGLFWKQKVVVDLRGPLNRDDFFCLFPF